MLEYTDVGAGGAVPTSGPETSERKAAGQLHCPQSCSGVYLNKCVGTILDLEQ